MSKAVGVEINESRVKVCSVESTSKHTKILAYHEEVIPTDPQQTWEQHALDSLKKAFSVSKLSKGRVVASIDSGDAILRDVSLPFKDDDKIRKTVHGELESLIHNFTIEDLVVDYFKTGETDKGTVLMAAAVPKAVIEKRLQLLTGAGIDPVALDLDVTALFNTLLNAGAIETDEPLLILYGTPKYTKILLVEKKRPTSIRTIRFSLPTPESIRKEHDERKKASQWETREVEGPVPILVLAPHEHAKFSELDAETQNSLIEILAKEISRFLLANAASASPTQILLTGEFENDEAAHLLQAATKIEVKTYNLLDVIDHPFTKPLPEQSAKLGVPLGLALKGCEVDALGMDFRKERFSYGKKFETIKTTALVTVELLIVFLLTVGLHFYFKGRDLQHLQKQVYEYQNDLYEMASGERSGDSKDAYPEMKQFVERMEREYGLIHPLDRSALEHWKGIAEATEEFRKRNSGKSAQELGGEELWLQLEQLSVSQSSYSGKVKLELTIRAKAATQEQVELFQRVLIEKMKDSRISIPTSMEKDKDGKFPFTLKVERDR